MKKRVNIYEAKTHLSDLIRQVKETGDHYTICKNNKPMVDLIPHRDVPEDFDPLQQDPALVGSATYLCDPLDSTEDLWPTESS